MEENVKINEQHYWREACTRIATDYENLRKASRELVEAALRVTSEYDGVHRLEQACSKVLAAMAQENGRGEPAAIDVANRLNQALQEDNIKKATKEKLSGAIPCTIKIVSGPPGLPGCTCPACDEPSPEDSMPEEADPGLAEPYKESDRTKGPSEDGQDEESENLKPVLTTFCSCGMALELASKYGEFLVFKQCPCKKMFKTFQQMIEIEERFSSIFRTQRKHHDLKIKPFWLYKIWQGQKTAEIRNNDRGYKPGDTVYLREYENGQYGTRGAFGEITFIINQAKGLKRGYVILCIDFKYLTTTEHDDPRGVE